MARLINGRDGPLTLAVNGSALTVFRDDVIIRFMATTTARPTRVIGYIRCSTEHQAEEGITLEAQRYRIEQYANLFGLELVAVFEDAGISAKTLERPGLQAALAGLRNGQAEGILVAKLDRLTRSVRDLGVLLEDFFAAGKFALLSVNEQIDTRSAAGRLMLNLLGAVSQWEREVIGDRTRDAMAMLKKKGVKMGGPALGWSRTDGLDDDGRRMIQTVEAEVATVERIVELRRGGMSFRQIASRLAAEGWKTKRGGRWQPFTVAKVIGRVENSRSTVEA